MLLLAVEPPQIRRWLMQREGSQERSNKLGAKTALSMTLTLLTRGSSLKAQIGTDEHKSPKPKFKT